MREKWSHNDPKITFKMIPKNSFNLAPKWHHNYQENALQDDSQNDSQNALQNVPTNNIDNYSKWSKMTHTYPKNDIQHDPKMSPRNDPTIVSKNAPRNDTKLDPTMKPQTAP